MLKDKYVRIARKARRACEIFAMSDEAVEYDFHNQEDLTCMCAIATFFLKDLFEKAGLKGNARQTRHHCFFETDGVVVDITFTQFGFKKKVYVDRLKSYSAFLREVTFDGNRRIPSVTKRLNGWPKGQKFNSEVGAKLMKIYNKI